MFAGYATLDGTLQNLVIASVNGLAVVPDAPPTWQVYGPGGAVPGATGTCDKFEADDGLYSYEIPVPGSSGFEVGASYSVVFRFALSGANALDTHFFMVT